MTRLAVHSELTVFVALDDAVKFSRLVLRNDSTRHRRLSATGYVEWVLGELRERNAPHIHTEIASDNGALYARNRYSNDFGDWIGFLDVDPGHRVGGSVTADRDEFIGRNGSLRRPAAMRRAQPVRSHRCRARPVQRDPGGDRAGAGQVAGDRLSPRHGPQRRRGRPAGAALPRQRRGAGGARRGPCALAPCTRRRAGRHARFVVEPAGQRLADVPDHRLPDVGPQRLLPVRRGVRLPRPAAGRDGGGPHPAPAAARAPAVQCEPTVRPRATFSTGGIRRRGAAFARAFRTITSGCRSRCAATCRRPTTPACSTRPWVSSTVHRWRRTRSRGTTCPGARPRRRACTSMRGERFSMGSAMAHTACR